MQRMFLAPAVVAGCLAVQTAGQSPGTMPGIMPGIMDHPTGAVVPYRLDGVVAEVVRVKRASWLRIHFDRVARARILDAQQYRVAACFHRAREGSTSAIARE